MARGRMMNRRISKSDKLAALAKDRYRVIYFMIYPHLDREGRFSADPRDIKEDCCPRLRYSLKDISESLSALHNVGLITVYAVNEKQYLEASRFDDFQMGLHKDREAPSEIPPNSGLTPETSGNCRTDVEKVPLNVNVNVKSNINSSCLPSKDIQANVDIELTQSLIDGILGNNPKASVIKRLTPKRKDEWINQCRLLREADGRTPEQILSVIQFSQTDNFWKTNILSMPTLREKWDQLFLKAKARGQGSGGYVRDEGARHVKLTPAEQAEEEKLRVEYKAELNKFLKERGYKSDEEMNFDELTSWSFERFKAQKKRGMNNAK